MGYVLIGKQVASDLRSVVGALEKLLSLPSSVEHESENYPNGFYFQSSTLGFEIAVFWIDPDSDIYSEFWYGLDITASENIESGLLVERGIADSCARVLSRAGLHVAMKLFQENGSIALRRYRFDPIGRYPNDIIVETQ